jgi:alpha/beta superfamily hydrolase
MNQPDINGLAWHLPVQVLSVSLENWRGDYDKLCIDTERGAIKCRLYDAANANAAVIIVAGNGDQFYSPAHDAYQRLAAAFRDASIATIQLSFRTSDKVEEAVHDLRAAIAFLRMDQAVHHVALIGQGVGAAAAINTAVMESDVEAVITLCTENTSTAATSGLHKPLLQIHDLSGGEAELFERCFSWITSTLSSAHSS